MGKVIRAIRASIAELRGAGSDAFWADWIENAGRKTTSGATVSEDTALKYAAFYGAVNSISSDIGKLPLKLIQRKGEGRKEIARKHPLFKLLHDRPNPEQTAFIFRQSMMSHALRWGNCYAEIVRDGGGRPVALYPIDPATVTVERRGFSDPLYAGRNAELLYIQRGTYGETAFRPSEIIHIRTIGDGYVGKSPVQLFREAVGLGISAETAGASLFGNGMRPGGVLSHPSNLSDPALNRLRKQYEDQAGGASNQGRLMIVEEGMKYEGMSIPPNDAQYLETRVHQVREIARIFRLPPHKLADLADATFSNVEEQNREYVDDCLAPWLVQWEQEITAKLLNPDEQDMYFPHFSLDAMLRGNATARAAFYSTMFHIGGMSINEIRDKEDLDTIGEDGDDHMIPVNLRPAGEAALLPPPPAQIPAAPPTNGPTRAIDAAHHALLRDTCARICRERERGKHKITTERGLTLLLAPVTCAAAVAGATQCNPADICAQMMAETTEDAMVNAAIMAIHGDQDA